MQILSMGIILLWSFPIMRIMMGLALMFGAGGAALFSIRLGERDKESAGVILGNSITMIFLTSFLFMVIALWQLEPLLRLFGADQDIMPYAKEYLIGVPKANLKFCLVNLHKSMCEHVMPNVVHGQHALAFLKFVVVHKALNTEPYVRATSYNCSSNYVRHNMSQVLYAQIDEVKFYERLLTLQSNMSIILYASILQGLLLGAIIL